MRRKCHFLILCLILLVGDSFAELEYRLSSDVVPVSYDIKIKPYLLATDGDKQFTFDGEVAIALRATLNNVTSITVHKDYIDIQSAWLDNRNGQTLETFNTVTLDYESITDKLTIPLQQALDVNVTYTLHFKYLGLLRDNDQGFFRAHYLDANGNEQWIGLTQMQRLNARTVFPCFDEPAFKATFRMEINRPSQYNSIFNTRLLNSVADGQDRYIDTFDETPVMSTYLVAFFVSDFVKRGNDTYSLLVWPSNKDKINFSYAVGIKAIAAFGDLFDIPYPELGNPIMQMASSPKFPHNGMENWGLIITKDEVLVHEPNYTDDWSNREYTITILVHETSHMWFGDSVTFEWWSYFWLNEGFARYYQYFMAHKLYPEYNLDLQFVVKQMHLIFGTDALNTTQPLTTGQQLIQTPAEIASKFSSIAYAKGACIVRMFRTNMGEENFDKAIRDYLKAYQLQNTKPSHLYARLALNWPKDQSVDHMQMFYDWTQQVGYPVLSVEMLDDKTVVLQQRRFLLNPDDTHLSGLRYTIPISYTTNLAKDFNRTEPRFYYAKQDPKITLYYPNAIDWVIFNVQQTNYHRVFYNDKLLNNIQKALAVNGHNNIHVNNRAALIDDLFNFVRAEFMHYDKLFAFLEYLKYEYEYTPWYATFSGLPRIVNRFSTDQLPAFRKFLFENAELVFTSLGVQSSSINETNASNVYNRKQLISWLCKYNYEPCTNQTDQIFQNLVIFGVKPSPDYRETIYCAALRQGEIWFYTYLLNAFTKEQRYSEKQMLIRSMGCTVKHMDYHFERVLSDDIPKEFKQIAITPMYRENPDQITNVFLLIKNNVTQLSEALESWSTVANIISDLATYFTTREQKQLLMDFIEESEVQFGESINVLRNAVTTVETNIQWAEKHLPNLITYLDNRNKNASNRHNNVSLLLMFVLLFLSTFYKIK